MNNLRESVGIDWYINKYQTSLYNYLLDRWGLTSDVLQGYGRVDRQSRGNEDYPAFPVGDGYKDYVDVTHEDTDAATYFFVVGESVSKGIYGEAPVSIVFVVSPERAGKSVHNESLRKDVIDFAIKPYAGFKLVGYETNIERVFAEFRKDKKLDMLPSTCFRTNYTLTFKH